MVFGKIKVDTLINSNGGNVDLTAVETSDATSSARGYMTAADKAKLDGVEDAATADQTGAEIKTAYEAEADTNAFTDALKLKLDGIDMATKADLVDGVVPTSQIPALAITEFLGEVANETAMLALTGQKGDWCLRQDNAVGYVITGSDPTQASSWSAVTLPGSAVTSINSQVGTVVLTASDVDAVDEAGGNMTGNLTLGTDKIQLNATSGAAEFAGGLDSGLYFRVTSTDDDYAPFRATNQAGDRIFDVNGLGSAYFASSVGIGTQTPGAKLEVDGQAYFTDRILCGDATSGTQAIKIPYAGTATAEIKVDGSAYFASNVGIGTAAPSTNLDVVGTGATIRAATDVNTDGAFVRVCESDFQGGYLKYDGANNLLHIGTHDLADENIANDADRITIQRTSGNVGFGTTPSTNLHVLSSGATEIKSESTGDNALISINNSSSVPWILTQRSDTSNGLSFRYAGNNYVNIDTSGRVGVGTTSPGTSVSGSAQGLSVAHSNVAFLSVENTAASGKRYTLYANDAGSLVTYDEDANATRMTIDSAGRVGIGTQAPISIFDVTVGGAGERKFVANYDDSVITIKGANSASNPETLRVVGDNIRFNIGTSGSGTERARLDSDGRVGIGTPSPSYLLDVNSSVIQVGNSTDAFVQYKSDAGNWHAGANSTDAFAIYSGTYGTGTERMRVNSTGVGINNSGPTEQLSVGGAIIATSNANNFQSATGGLIDYHNFNMRIAATATSGVSNAISFFTSSSGSQHQRMHIEGSGRVLIGHASTISGEGLSVYSTSTNVNTGSFYCKNNSTTASHPAAAFAVGTNNTSTSNILIRFGINSYNSGSGTITANGAGQAAFGSFSDERLKENIADLPSQWDNIKALRPVEFDYIESQGGEHQVGFIAQEFETVYPDAVGTSPMFNSDGETVEDDRLTITGWTKTEARLVKALQEAIAKIETLEAKVAALEAG